MSQQAARQIQLTQGQVAIVDAADYERLSQWKWYAEWRPNTRSYYAARRSDNRTIYMHRQLVGLDAGDSRQADHRNHDTLDDRRINLRVCTHAQNQRNSRIQRNNTSGFKGVHFHKRHKKFCARICVDGVQKTLGYFADPAVAALAYNRAAIEHYGAFALLNTHY